MFALDVFSSTDRMPGPIVIHNYGVDARANPLIMTCSRFKSMPRFDPILRVFILHTGKIVQYPLLDVIPSASKGRSLILVTPLHLRRVTETMLEETFRS